MEPTLLKINDDPAGTKLLMLSCRFKQAYSLQQQDILTLHLQVQLTYVQSAEIRELKLTQNRAKLRDC